jgi:catechol 2,3-dioxygenase-like lactoylglutathione lyase family enzyme
MKVKALTWMGAKTTRFNEMVRFYQDILKLQPEFLEEALAFYRLPNGDILELFGPGGPYSDLPEGTVMYGLAVDDIEQARQELIDAGLELVGPLERNEKDHSAWQYFRAPDGSLCELCSEPLKQEE